eukprot:2503021-Karenia_brevis.AAC.1
MGVRVPEPFTRPLKTTTSHVPISFHQALSPMMRTSTTTLTLTRRMRATLVLKIFSAFLAE